MNATATIIENPRIPANAQVFETRGSFSVGLFKEVQYIAIYTGTNAEAKKMVRFLNLYTTYSMARNLAQIFLSDDPQNYYIAAVVTPSKTAEFFKAMFGM
jgi:hypothetical protein